MSEAKPAAEQLPAQPAAPAQIVCPDCGGEGTDEAGGLCPLCEGTGHINA